MFECYDNIIGLSQDDCDCTAANRPADYNTSKSGLFLDDLSPIQGLIKMGECDNDVWDVVTKARDFAIRQLVADSNALLALKYTPRRKSVSKEVLGQIKAKNTVIPSKNYGVVVLSCCPIRGGIMRIRNLSGIFSEVGTISVELHNNVDGLLDSFDINTLANKISGTEINLELPLFSKYVPVLEYYLVYTFDNANLPKDNKVDCGCSSWKPNFNSNSPYFHDNAQGSPAWSSYVMVGGTEINSLTELDDLPATMSSKMKGLSLELDFSCKVNEVICEDSLDFVGNPLALSLAFAVKYAAAARIAESLLKSTLLNRENMLAREEWEDSSIVWTEKYNEHINYVVSNVDHSANDCLQCKDLLGMGRQGLFS